MQVLEKAESSLLSGFNYQFNELEKRYVEAKDNVKFLTTLASSVHHGLFASPQVLQNVCEKIIAPNVQLLTQDEELFEDNPPDYIRKDM